MRSFRQSQIYPPTLQAGNKGGRKRDEHEQAADKKSLDFPDHWNEPDVRGILYSAQGRVCGFCGCQLPRNDRGDVEHFRPKNSTRGIPPNGGYWWLAYDATNYLLSCSVCNRTHKRTKFPLLNEPLRVDSITRGAIAQEAPVLFHPAFESVEELLVFDIENGFIDPAPGLTPEQLQRIEHLRKFFQWNLDSRLILERRQVRDQVLKMLNEGREDEVKVLASRFSRHSLMVLAVLGRTNRLDLAPTQLEEVQMFALEVLEELKIQLQTPQDGKAAESFWLMRAMWEDASPQLQTWLEDRWREIGCETSITALTF
jgi:uncharacterized protein (TIGR02646 family)